MQQVKPFAYDLVLSLDASPRVRPALTGIERSLKDKQLLAATFNHRFFDLREKNLIKGTIEAHELDHLMFSMRPSSMRLIAEGGPDYIGRFRDLSQILFVLEAMARYDIPAAALDLSSLGLNAGR